MTDSTREQQLSLLSIEINFYMTRVANERYYGSPEACISYINSSVPQWKNEAIAYNAWRDACWLIIMPMIVALQPDDPVPTIDEIVSQLPVIEWPVFG